MPVYEFRCADCTDFDQAYPIASVPEETGCPNCGKPARRRMSAPHLSVAGSAAYRLLDRTSRSAVEPDVVSAPPPVPRSGRGQRVTANPLHRKLPRP
jgi:putative FmdB family regulatory protein